jgi:hypothetical protein
MNAKWIAATALAVCACTQRPAALPSSAGQPAYALHYASELTQATKRIDEDQTRQKTLAADIEARIEELKKPKWDHVRAIVDDSDAVGRASDFAESRDGMESVRSFWSDEKDGITNRVAGSAQGLVQKAHCSASAGASGHAGDSSLDVRGPIAYSMNESMDKQLQKRLRAHNDAFLLIERYKTELGPQNVASLEKLADEIAESSYVVHVGLPAARDRLRRLLADKQAVGDTLIRYANEEKASESEPGRAEADIKASEERIAAANRSQTDVDGVAGQASASSKAVDDRVTRATKDYDDTLNAIRAKIDDKKKAAGQ